ncbi:helix-turn-helix domain-containing protein [Noviherbaspirillum galbum]|uniref:Helix-turn-helix domain-containing protein n=1 Tax=Noviherbaspirillum galbum TaxID=2709383 RepID=A0A6B3SM90_9BURK|nr:helix-turn-helix transcriptional regulator [Noviherbaspirillum galbum]NEX59482.1 helix-turn-helix domain-containing protein [Noviherbaspirillum galbum]
MSNRLERQAFSGRLVAALKFRGHQCFPTGVMRLYNGVQKGDGVTVAAVRKWLVGESVPTQEKIQSLAAVLDVSPEWLRFGTGPMISSDSPGRLNEEELELLQNYRKLASHHRVALLNYLRRAQ